MRFRSMEDRLNPEPPAGADESTLGGYPAIHGRAPGFDGSDGSPYTVAIETDQIEDGGGGWAAYLIFLRWAESGTAIMGHLETEDLAFGSSPEEARKELEKMPLTRVKEVLEGKIAERGNGG